MKEMLSEEERKQRHNESSKRYLLAHPDRRQASVDKYHATHIEEERLKSRQRGKQVRAASNYKYKQTEAGHLSQRRHRLKRYGLSLEDYDSLVKKQAGLCAICHKPETRKGTKYLAVDHNHATGKVRALLCHNCNRYLGILESTWAKEAAKYLVKYK